MDRLQAVIHERDRPVLWAGEFLCTCLAFQPLNFVARRRWQQAAELLCDDWAIEQRVSATSLASCLTRIAEWRLDRQSGLMSLSAVGHSGSLTRRIEWLLRKGRASESKRSRGRTLATLVVFTAGLFVGTYGPRLTLLVPAEAADDSSIASLWNEIDHELTSTLNELARVEAHLSAESDREIASLADQMRQRSDMLRVRRAQFDPQ